MANKCLRKCLRSGFLFFLHRQSAAADRELHTLHDQPYSDPVITSMSSSSSCSSMRAASHRSACQPLHLAASPCLSTAASSSSSCLIADERKDLYGYGDHEVEHLYSCDNAKHLHLSADGHKRLKARSHSCSKLHCRLTVPSFKSLLQRTQSHGRLHDGRHGQISSSSSLSVEHVDAAGHFCSKSAASSPSYVGEYTRSWSSPGLHIRRHMKKAGSFHGELQGSSKVKRAPKGHVAVYVDGGKERYVVPIPYLSHPHFQELLQRAESEFGFAQKGRLLIPCSLSELQHTLSRIRLDQSQQ